jgi:hypothetical protein
MPPPEDCKNEAQKRHPERETHGDPVPGRRGISVKRQLRPVDKIENVIIGERDFSLDKAKPQLATAIDAHADSDDASDDLIKEKTACERPLFKYSFDEWALGGGRSVVGRPFYQFLTTGRNF